MQLIEHALPKLAGWIRYPVGHTEDLKNGTFDLSSLVLRVDMWVCKVTVHTRWRHWLDTSAAFTAKPAAWPTAQAYGDGRPRITLLLKRADIFLVHSDL